MLWALLSFLSAGPNLGDLATQPETTVADDASDGAKGIRAQFVVHDSADAVADLIWQGKWVRNIFPEVKERTLAKRESEDSILVDYIADGGITEFKYRVRFVRERVASGALVIRWAKVSGDMDIVRGSWTFTPLAPDYCRAEYVSFATLGPALFSGFVRDGLAKSTKGLAERVRRSAAERAAIHASPASPGSPIPAAAQSP